MVKKSHFTKYLDISKREIRMFTFIHLNFECKHWNLRLRLYLLWIKIIDKYKMITKMLWPLIQINLPLMFYINESSNLKPLYFFLRKIFTRTKKHKKHRKPQEAQKSTKSTEKHKKHKKAQKAQNANKRLSLRCFLCT